jgi:4-hydroxy-tetrahydrodipicolinate reductase
MSTHEIIPIAITGARGRMGTRLCALAEQDPQLRVAAKLEVEDRTLSSPAKVLIDFTTPEGMRHWIPICRECGIAMVIGTTGLTADDHKLIDAAAADIAVLQAPNMSVGVNLLFRIAAEVARTLGQEYDIEIVEAHHRFKKDAPSGTAIGLADAIKNATQRDVPMHSLRIGDEVGKHTAYFAALGERLELTHVATNRDTFALGALRAAKWLASQKRGRYGMNDVLGFNH